MRNPTMKSSAMMMPDSSGDRVPKALRSSEVTGGEREVGEDLHDGGAGVGDDHADRVERDEDQGHEGAEDGAGVFGGA